MALSNNGRFFVSPEPTRARHFVAQILRERSGGNFVPRAFSFFKKEISNMAAAVRVCVRLRKIANPCSSLQAFTLRTSCITEKRLLSSSRVFYSASDEIESNPFYEKYAARIKEVRNEIKEGKL